MITSYKTLIVRFNSPIAVIDEVFNDVAYLGVGNLKEWIDDYESTLLVFCYYCKGGMMFKPFSYAFHIILACDDCRLFVYCGETCGGATTALISQ